jgi:hypothetical protein
MQPDSLMKLVTIFFFVIESSKFEETVVTEIIKPCLECHPVSFFKKRGKEVVQFFLILQPPFIYFMIDLFT